MMPGTSRRVAYWIAAAFGVLGAALYLFPDRAGRNFAWTVTPFVTMTIGAWFLGGAFVAWRSARLGAWSTAYPGLLFLGVFGILQSAVLLVSSGDLEVRGQPGAGYLLAVAAVTLAGLWWVYEWSRDRGEPASGGTPTPLALRVVSAVFVLFSAFFGIRLLFGISQGGNIWPGVLSPVTGRSFGAFYLALAIAVAPLVFSRTLAPILALLPAAVVGSVVITIPALVHIELFDFGARPGGLVYLGTYLLAALVATVILLRVRLAANRRGSG
ncbi:MAG TPA: hypothetical protein VHL54_06785 [Actinomycetota bacterium]|nr:hypothetical protein [Actinomycetota bacterium]